MFLLMGKVVVAQTSLLNGKVISEKNEPLPGVSVEVIGEPISTITNIQGHFQIKLSEGKKYEIRFTAIGYESISITDVMAGKGNTEDLTVVLAIKSKTAENIVITANRNSAPRETVNSIIAFQKNTNTVASVISAETIRRSPDKNTSEILKRIPGTSIQEGKYLVVRGLSDRYNAAMLNGIQLSSTEPDRKTFSFDIFPSAVVDHIIINKAFVPEFPGEWAGGLVQVNTKDIPGSGFFTIQAGTGFNTRTLGRDFYTYKGGRFDWLGFDDGSRALPDNFPVKSEFREASDLQKTELGKKIAAGNWSLQKAGIPLNTTFQASGGTRTNLFGKQLGIIAGLTYNRSLRNLDYENRFYSFDNSQASLLFDYNNNKYSTDVLAGAMANFSLMLNNNNRISLKNLLNVTSSDFTSLRTGLDFEQDPEHGDMIRARELGFKSNSFYNSHLSGEHFIKSTGSRLAWYGSFNILDAYTPQQKRVQYNQAEEGQPYSLLIGEARSQKTGSVFYSMLSDYIYNAGGNWDQSFNLFGRRQGVKAGYLFQVKDRLFDSRPFSIYLTDGTSPLRLLNEDEVFAAGNFDASDPRKFKFDEIIGKQFRYMANSIMNAGYVQFDNQLGSKLRVVWGARYEHFDQLVGSANKNDERFSNRITGDLLPAINATIKLDSKTNLRISGSQTVIRPEFRELTNFAFYDFELGAAVIGSSTLKRTKVTNADLRYEIYPNAGEMVTAGVFYKYFQDPIELYYNQSGVATNTFNYLNIEKAISYGFEFEMRKRLDFSDLTKNFILQTNLSYIFNKVKDEGISVNRPMQGQSPYLINASVQYDHSRTGFSATALFNQIGRRILYVGNDVIPAIWEAPRPLLDLQLAKKIMNEKAEIKLNISDLFSQKAVFYHDLDENKEFNHAKDVKAIERSYGTNISISFGYTIK